MTLLLPPPAEVEAPGDQRPRIENKPANVYGTFGPKVIEFAAACGVGLDDWQQYVINGLFAVLENGQWAASEFGLLVARQNGKGEILVVYDLAHLFMFPRADNRRKTVLHTAHEFKTADDGFQRLTGVIESKGKLMDRVAENGIRVGSDRPGITLNKREGQLNADRIRFLARTRNSGRGLSGDVNVYDEAQELSGTKHDALSYTQTTAPNRQEVYTGTAPTPENDPEVFEGVRDRGRAGSDDRTGWMEWTPIGSEDPKALVSHPRQPVVEVLGQKKAVVIDLGSDAVARAANPALNIRAFNLDVVHKEVKRATDIAALGVERFSIWPNRPEATEVKANELDLEVWDRHADEKMRYKPSKPTGEHVPEVIAVAFGRGSQYATIAFGSRYDDDHLAAAHHRTSKGTLWVAKDIAELKAEYPRALVVFDPKNAQTLSSDLDAKRIRYIALNLNELAAAYASSVERINAGLVKHPPQKEVRASFKAATPRAIGQTGYTWDASDSATPVSLAQAVTWALFGVQKLEARHRGAGSEVKGYA